MKYLKDVTVPNEMLTSYLLDWMKSDNIGYECSPMEAEWQLVKLEREKRIDAIMTTDGDAIVLGANVVLFDVNFTKKECRVFRKEEFFMEMQH
jgi:5'-3' exonuclease